MMGVQQSMQSLFLASSHKRSYGIFPQKIIRACFYWARTKLHPQQKLFKRSPDQLELFVCSGGLVSGTLSPRFFYLDLGRCLGPDPSTNNGGR